MAGAMRKMGVYLGLVEDDPNAHAYAASGSSRVREVEDFDEYTYGHAEDGAGYETYERPAPRYEPPAEREVQRIDYAASAPRTTPTGDLRTRAPRTASRRCTRAPTTRRARSASTSATAHR